MRKLLLIWFAFCIAIGWGWKFVCRPFLSSWRFSMRDNCQLGFCATVGGDVTRIVKKVMIPLEKKKPENFHWLFLLALVWLMRCMHRRQSITKCNKFEVVLHCIWGSADVGLFWNYQVYRLRDKKFNTVLINETMRKLNFKYFPPRVSKQSPFFLRRTQTQTEICQS